MDRITTIPNGSDNDTLAINNGTTKRTWAEAVIISKAENGDNTSCDEDDEEEEGKHFTTTSSSTTSSSKRFHKNNRKLFRSTHGHASLAATNSTETAYQRPPDGGWGWWVVLASFMINFICDGLSFSSGFFFVDLVKTFKESKSKTAWVNSLFLSIPLIAGPVASALTDHFGCRRMAIIGSITASTGFILGTFATSIEHLLITFSISGLGMAFCYVTSIVSVAYYFEKRRSLATGLAVCGSGFGTMLLPPLCNFLLQHLKWQNTFLVVALIFLTIVAFGFLIRDLDIDTLILSREVSSSEDDDDDDDEEEDEEGEDDLNGQDDSLNICSSSNFNSQGLSLPSTPFPLDGSRQASHRSLKNIDESPTSRNNVSGRKRHVSEDLDPAEKIARTSTSLINIPTYLQNVKKRSSVEVEAGDTQFNEMFRNGGHLNNLIKCYPHLLDFFIPSGSDSMEKFQTSTSEEKTSKTVIMPDSTPDTTIDVEKVKTETPCNEERKVVDFTLPEEEISNAGSAYDLNYPRDSINLNSISSPNIVADKHGNRHVDRPHKEMLRKSTGQLYNFRPGGGRHVGIAHRQSQAGELGGGNTLHKLRLQRGSLTYRGAMLVVGSKYRLKASSAPDIYRTSMATINGESKRYTIMENIKEIVWDMADVSSFKSVRYSIFCLSNFLLYICVDVPYVHLPDHVEDTGAANNESASWLISIIGIFNTLGVVFVGYIGDKPCLDASFVYALFISISGLALAAIPLCGTSYLAIALLSALYGFTISANYSLVSIILVELVSLDMFTNAYGMLLLVQGFGSLLGPPVAGWLFDTYASYNSAFYIFGCLVSLSGMLVLPICKKKNCFLWAEGRRAMAKPRRRSSSVSKSMSTESLRSKKSINSVSLLFSNIPLSEVGTNGKHSMRNRNIKHDNHHSVNVIAEKNEATTLTTSGREKNDSTC